MYIKYYKFKSDQNSLTDNSKKKKKKERKEGKKKKKSKKAVTSGDLSASPSQVTFPICYL